MAELIDKQKTLNDMIKHLGIKNEDYLLYMERMMYNVVKQASAVDATEVVRCKDCVNYKTPYCTMDAWVGNAVLYRAKENDFCSYGKRKENG